MDRKIAERLMASTKSLDPILGEIDSAISEIEDEDERKALVKNLGEVLLQVYEGFYVQVCRQYPDLADEE